jgi:uncharacterized protein
MKLLVFSDSHGELARMKRAVEREKPDLLIHLGDYWRDGERLTEQFPQLRMEQVPGNCDGSTVHETERMIYPAGVGILLMHGHSRSVKSSLLPAAYAARERGAQLLLFGHTHVPTIETMGGLWLMNPGSIGRGRPATYGVVELRAGELRPALYAAE